ncbi:MAG: alpha/beta hydrolase [Thermoleophilaceae bacterium]|nr:alpha/beta hydrolase [Thermoleophilaceae bacterium]
MLLVSPILADGFLPLLSEPALAGAYQLIRYHKRRWGGSTHTPPPVTIADHAGDAAALLEALGIDRAHVAGHSSGAAVAVQLALDHPRAAHSVMLLELSLLSLPAGKAFLEGAAPVFETYTKGAHERALAMFLKRCERPRLAVMPGAPRGACARRRRERARGCGHVVRSRASGMVEWTFDAEQAASIRQPVLAVIGAETKPLWTEIAGFLRSSLTRVEDCTIDGVGHLLHIQRPESVARELAKFLARHPIAGARPVEALQAG